MTVAHEVRAAVGRALPHGLGWTEPMVSKALGVTTALEIVENTTEKVATFTAGVVKKMDLRVVVNGGAIPRDGALIVVANHHLGAVDGLILFNMLLSVRPDAKVLANAGLAVLPAVRPHLVTVPPKGSVERRGLALPAAQAHLRGGGALLVFPAGEVAAASSAGKVRDERWHSGVGHLVIATDATTLPVFVHARNSVLFYVLRRISRRLSALMLVREALRMRGREICVSVGVPRPAAGFEGMTAEAIVERLRAAVDRLGRDVPVRDASLPVRRAQLSGW